MDDTHSELPVDDPTSNGGLLIRALGLAINDEPQIAERVLAQNPQLWEPLERFKWLLDTAKQPPRDKIHTAVDNSIPNSMEIDPNIHDAGLDPNQIGCSAVTVVSPPLQSDLPRWPMVSLMVSPTSMNTSNRSALVIEHDRSLSRMYATYLKYEGYVVRTAYESEDALRLYRDCAPFDVVLVDHHMPRRSGFDVAFGILKQDPTQPMIITALQYSTEDEVPRPDELRHIPLLLDTSNGRLRKLLQKYQRWATREEVDKAYAALTNVELLKLRQFGNGRVYWARGTDDRTGEDLLQEALRSTFEGANGGGNGRRWNRRVTFFIHLVGAIRGISGRRKDDGALLECDAYKRDASGQEFSLLANIPALDIRADERMIAEEEFNRTLERLKDDPAALLVLQGWSQGMNRNEILEEGLSENQYRAAVRRIRIKLLSPKNGGGEKHDGQDQLR
jgi:CheY-like chemotaxis protein